MLDSTQLYRISGDDQTGVLSVEPLEAGYGHTLGNSLRRVLLNMLPGAAVTSVRIKGAPHQFMSLPGMKEDVVDLVLQIKKLRFVFDSEEPVVLKLQAKGPGPITAESIAAHAQVEVVNKDLVLCHLADEKATLSVDITVSKGVGYETIEDRVAVNPDLKADLGEIMVDSLYSPVVRVNYKVESTRVGRLTNYDRLVIEMQTDGTVSCEVALQQASRLLSEDFMKLSGMQAGAKASSDASTPVMAAPAHKSTLVEELDLPPKITNRLKENGLATADDIVRVGRDELLKLPNFGEKSLKELEAKLEEKGYTL